MFRLSGRTARTYPPAAVWPWVFWINGGVHMLFLIIVLIVLLRS